MPQYEIDTHVQLVNKSFELENLRDEEPDSLLVTAAGIIEQTTPGLSAVLMAVDTSLFNFGQILSLGSGGIAVTMKQAATVVNSAGGVIRGGYAGIMCSNSALEIMNEFGASIVGGTAGILLKPANAFIENAGTISGQVGIHMIEGGAPSRQYFTLLNSGSLISTEPGPGAYAIRVNSVASGDISNSGYIKGAIHNFALFDSSLSNSGIIDGDVFLVAQDSEGSANYWGDGGRVNGTIYAVSNDTIFIGGSYVDRFVGSDGFDRAYGGAGNDVLDVGGGVNLLEGGLGGDRLVSGGSQDRFIYRSKADSTTGTNADIISGFGASDLIDLSEVESYVEQRRFIGTQAFLDDGSFQVRAVRTGTNSHVVYVDADGDAVKDMTIYVNGQSALLNAADFLLS